MISVMKASQLFTSITIVLSLTVAHTQAAETFLITKGTDGLASNSSSTTPSINGDGSKIVFASGASNLIAPTPQGSSNIYLYDANDTSINKIRLISKSMIDGKSGNNFSRQPSIDSTGRYITFQSSANNLVPNDTSLTDIFLYDLQTDELVNISYGGNNNSWNPQVSGNGAYVIFESLATNLVSGDTNGKTDVFAYDIANRALKNITKQGVNESFLTSISYNGQFITFTSLASEFVSVDKNPSYDIFIYDQVANTYEIVNIDENGNQDFGLSLSPDVSRDGRFVTFLSYSNTLVQGDTNGLVDVYLRDRKNNTTTRVTKNLITNAESDSPTFRPQISDDGRFIVYMSRATTLVAGNPDGKAQVFVFDRLLKTTEIASVKLDGTPSTGDVEYFTSLNSDGSMIAFSSNATDLVTNVGNSLVDIYLRVRDPILDLTPNAVAGADQVLQCSAGGATVSLNGSASSDPEEQELSYQWTNSTTVVTGKFAQMDLPVGTHTIELRVTDPKGNSATDTLVVQVNDSVAPSLQVNELSVTLEAQRVEGALYTPSYTTSDNCSKVSVLVNPTPNYYPLGKTVVTLSAQDQSGNLSTGTIDVVVRDTTKPVLTIPADIIEEAKAKKTMVTLGKATATDIFPVTVSNDAPVTGFGLGETLVNWSAVDSNNNKAVATQRVTIRDTLAPVIN
ncbi:MAG: hypothetical protein OEX00_10275, partial [Gammaproteobacteria bacterium]|nr:hypothetical protein [Gammaproteobacteria bacterium]